MTRDQMTVSVSNIGGIEETELTFNPGVSVLAGRNATNRTSFLKALMAAFGSEQASLKADAEEGSVELTINGDRYTRTLSRTNGDVVYGGDPFLDDATVADLFAFLIESNEARLAIARGENLREIIMRPIDTASIQAEITRLENEKRDIDKQIDEIESLSQKKQTLKERLEARKREIEETEAELEEKEAELNELDRDLEETRQEKTEFEETFEELRQARQDREEYQFKLETEQESLESLKAEQEELDEAWDELDTVSESRLAELDSELQDLRSEKQALESEISTLQRVTKFNEDLLGGASEEITRALRTNGGSESASLVTDQLLAGDETVCWTCGSTVEKSSIEDTLDRLRSLLGDKHGELRDHESEIENIQSKKKSIESQQKRAEDVSRRRSEVADEIERRRAEVESLREKIEEKSSAIEQLEAEAESLEEGSYSEILQTHKEVNQLEFELDRLRKERTEIEENLETINARIAEKTSLEDRRDEVTGELQELRTRIERLEKDAVDAFNEHMDEMLEVLAYENIARIWLERTERQVQEGRRKVTESVFELHVVRTASDGTSFEDTVDHLSESEREVTGLIFALAGYLVHDVHEVVPVMLLDSLEAIDSNRIAALVDYFEQYAEYLLIALLPEDASAFDEPHDIIQTF